MGNSSEFELETMELESMKRGIQMQSYEGTPLYKS